MITDLNDISKKGLKYWVDVNLSFDYKPKGENDE